MHTHIHTPHHTHTPHTTARIHTPHTTAHTHITHTHHWHTHHTRRTSLTFSPLAKKLCFSATTEGWSNIFMICSSRFYITVTGPSTHAQNQRAEWTTTGENETTTTKKRTGTFTLNRRSCKTFLIATVSPVSIAVAWYTMPKEPLPMTLSAA